MRRVLWVVVVGSILAACGGATSSGTDDQATDGAVTNAVTSETEPDIADPVSDTEAPDVIGGADDSAATDFGDAGPPVDACALLTTDEVAAALGAAVTSEEPETVAGIFFGCRWDGDGSFLTLDVISHPNPESARASFDIYLGDVTTIDGIGDAALSNDLVELAFIDGGFEVDFDLSGDFERDVALQRTQDLARLVIPRLP